MHEKVLFAYPKLIREGMVELGFFTPDAVLYDINHEKNYSVVITAGFLTKSMGSYWNEVDVKHGNETVISPNHDGESKYQVLASSQSSAGQHVTTSSFFIKAVKFPVPGLYTATVSLYEGDADGDKGLLLDFKECSFVVAGEN